MLLILFLLFRGPGPSLRAVSSQKLALLPGGTGDGKFNVFIGESPFPAAQVLIVLYRVAVSRATVAARIYLEKA